MPDDRTKELSVEDILCPHGWRRPEHGGLGCAECRDERARSSKTETDPYMESITSGCYALPDPPEHPPSNEVTPRTPRAPGKPLPCPLCGCDAELREWPVWGDNWGEWQKIIWCTSSHCRLQMRLPADIWDVEARLVEKWNNRVRKSVETAERHCPECGMLLSHAPGCHAVETSVEHGPGCWHDHLPCAIRQVELLTAELDRARHVASASENGDGGV
jgi:hypothetical protein